MIGVKVRVEFHLFPPRRWEKPKTFPPTRWEVYKVFGLDIVYSVCYYMQNRVTKILVY